MRAIFLAILAIASFAIAKESLQPEFNLGREGRIYESQINATLESLKELLMNGNETLGIPSFNPLQIPEYLLLLQGNDVLTTNLTLNNVVVSGIPDFVATSLSFNLIGFKFSGTLHFNEIRATADYGGDAELFGFVPMYGHGHGDVTFTGIDVSISLNIATPGGLIDIQKLEFVLGLQGANFNISGLLDNEDASILFSQLLTDVVPDFIQNRGDWLTYRLSPIIENILNNMLAGLTVDDLLGLISGGTA